MWAVAGLCLATQLVSATMVVRTFDSPNTASLIASSLSGTGRYELPVWYRPIGPVGAAAAPARAYHLPGEVLYLALAFQYLPAAWWPYLHVPVTVLLVVAVTATALAIAGRSAALVAGLAASCDPFVLVHGPVWDDLFLAAALEWTVFALIAAAAVRRGSTDARRRPWALAAIAVCAGWAAITRSEAALLLGVVGLVLLTAPRWRELRPMGGAVVLGIALASAAWGVRNAVVIGSVLVGSTHDGITLYESNSAHARDAILRFGAAGGTGGSYEPAVFARRAGEGEAAANAAFAREAIARVISHPADAARTSALKSVVSLSGVDLGRPLGSVRNLAGLARCAALLVMGSVGLRRWFRRSAGPASSLVALCLAATMGVSTVVLLAGPVGQRYWVVAAGFLYVGIGVAVSRAGAA